ncbi:hypothetical protein WISP_22187 [Willisornis vidua]|uniref:Uncharacterized protein n=1 Tax=Willisornis vidua TaxID=1566151 RepID=A0ABQ9DTT7_9PASS|nr:hypothetical protein WISP_22187 [Willisornis vidua]
MTLQVVVRPEQRPGPQMQKQGEQPWRGEKKQLTKKQQQQQQRGAARSNQEQPENGFSSTSAHTHTHSAPEFCPAKKMEKSPKPKETTCPPPNHQEEDGSS